MKLLLDSASIPRLRLRSYSLKRYVISNEHAVSSACQPHLYRFASFLTTHSHHPWPARFLRCQSCLRDIIKTTQRAIWESHGKRLLSSVSWREEPKEILFRADCYTSWRTKTVQVPVGGNGTVSLDITARPPTSNNRRDDPTSAQDVIIYLPPGPLPCNLTKNSTEDAFQGWTQASGAAVELISSKVAAIASDKQSVPIVVKVNYRLSPVVESGAFSQDHRFPAPIHDVSSAFDWIVANISTLTDTAEARLPDDPHLDRPEQRLRISVFGSHIGGSLALMLALTQPNDIHAIAVSDPITDWMVLDELAESASVPTFAKKRTRPDLEVTRLQTRRAADALIKLRTRIFRNPSGFFDAFASPLLFLRAPGRDTPLWKTARPVTEDSVLNDANWLTQMKQDGGIQVDRLETKEVIEEMGYGPYDDDWHTAEIGLANKTSSNALAVSEQGANHSASQMSTESLRSRALSFPQEISTETNVSDLAKLSNVLSKTEAVTSRQSLSQVLAEPDEETESSRLGPRRRRVIRRWPPIGRPEDVDLPWTRIYSTSYPRGTELATLEQVSGIDLSYVLHPQAKEMVDVMTRACFWGREKSLGEERVGLEIVDASWEDTETEEQCETNNAEATNGHGAHLDSKEHIVMQNAIAWLMEMRELEK